MTDPRDAMLQTAVEALEACVFALGRTGANVLGGPNRTEWEAARSALSLLRAALEAREDKQPLSRNWWCPYCECEVPPEHVTYEETHDPRHGGCSSKVLAASPVAAPATLPESMSRDEMLRYYSEYANMVANEVVGYQKQIRDLKAASPVAAPVEAREPKPQRRTRDVAGILHFLTPQQMAEEIVRLDATLAADTGGAWQPIETAPKDGKQVLLFEEGSRGGTFVGHWLEWRPDPIRTGWVTNAGYKLKPSHWMPLPPPPVAAMKEQPSDGVKESDHG